MKTSSASVILLLACLFAGCQAKEESPPAPTGPGPKVEGGKITMPANAPQQTSLAVETVEARKAFVSHLTGRLLWNDEVTVRVFSPIGGRVTSIDVKLGDKITKGDTLARILSPDLGQAQSDARKAGSDLQLAERNLNRLRELFEHGAAPRKDVEAAEADFARATSEKERTRALLAIYGITGNAIDQQFALKSPIAGTVVEKNINAGQEVRPDQMLANAPQLFAPLFVVTDPTSLWVQLDVLETDVANLKPGLPLRIHTKAAPDTVFDGQLDVIGDSLDPATRTVRVRGTVSNLQKLLKAEMYVTVDIANSNAAAPIAGVDVSTKAVFLKDNQHYVFVEQAPGQYERRAVELGPEQNGKTLILEGIKPGQKVVTEGCLLLQALMEAGQKS